MKTNTKKVTAVGMLCALAYASTTLGRFPLVLFLKYDPKDSVIALGGLILGPPAALAVTVLVSLLELFTLSETGPLGFVMNVISSCSFACPAALLYRRRPRFSGAAAGLLCGWCCMVLVMMLWNWLITPVYMGISREEVAKLLLPAFLPFNLIKGGLNGAIALLLYRPVTGALGGGAPGQRPKRGPGV